MGVEFFNAVDGSEYSCMVKSIKEICACYGIYPMLTACFREYEIWCAALVKRIRLYGYKNAGKLGKKGLAMETGRWNVRDTVGKLI
jgi:hypothetical protein